MLYPAELVARGAPREGIEPPSSGSKPDVLPVTPSRNRLVESPKSKVCLTSVDYGLWTLDFGLRFLEAMKGVEPLSSGLQDRRSAIQLSYIAQNSWWS